jgi:hypothetical protein
MRVVALDDDGASRGEGRRGIATRDREGEREVARSEHGNGSQRYRTLANVGARQWRSVGLGRVDAGTGPATLAQYRGEQSKLSSGPADLALEAAFRQSALGHGSGDQRVGDGFDVGGGGLEEECASLGGRRPVGGIRLGGGLACSLDVRRIAVAVSKPRISSPVPATSAPAMIICPVSCVDSAIVAVTLPTL